jgi:hypothetical protein
MAKTLDSSEIFRQQNYRGKIREVALTGKVFHFGTLRESLSFTEEKEYVPIGISIVNFVHGGPDTNEPLNAIYFACKHSENLANIDALVLQIEEDGAVGYRVCENFRFLA